MRYTQETSRRIDRDTCSPNPASGMGSPHRKPNPRKRPELARCYPDHRCHRPRSCHPRAFRGCPRFPPCRPEALAQWHLQSGPRRSHHRRVPASRRLGSARHPLVQRPSHRGSSRPSPLRASSHAIGNRTTRWPALCKACELRGGHASKRPSKSCPSNTSTLGSSKRPPNRQTTRTDPQAHVLWLRACA